MLAARENPLVIPILRLLRSNESGLSEYQLISLLEETNGPIVESIDSAGGANSCDMESAEHQQMALFRQHFCVMNALYQLQNNLLDQGLYLSISPLCIEIQSLSDQSEETCITSGSEGKLREYYLDWRHFIDTTESELEAMLDKFWSRFHAMDTRIEALSVFGLNQNATWSEIQRRYRSLAAKHHPDKGGDQKQFITITEAYEVLRHAYPKEQKIG